MHLILPDINGQYGLFVLLLIILTDINGLYGLFVLLFNGGFVTPHRTISNSLKTWKLWKTWWPLTITKIHLKFIVPCSLILLIKKGPLTCCQLPTQNMQIYISLQLYYTSKYIKPFKLLPVIIAWRQAR